MAACIALQNPERIALCEARLIAAAQTVLDDHPFFRAVSMTIIVTNSRTMRELNRRHRQVDAATDVLAFVAPPLPDKIGQEQRYLGDILLAHDYATRKADSRGTDIDETLCLLVIHGALHLLGYQHYTPEGCALMWAAQANALERLDINRAIVDRYETAELA